MRADRTEDASSRLWGLTKLNGESMPGWVPKGDEPGRVPSGPRPVRRSVPRPAVVAALVVAVMVVVGVLARGWSSDAGALRGGDRTTTIARRPPSTGSSPTLPVSDGVLSSVSASPAGIVVDVVGRVRRPGLARLPTGARVADAITAAGGVSSGAVVHRLNLARKLTDGEQLVVPGPGDPDPPGGGSVGAAASGQVTESSGPIDLNSATVAQLDALPGVGPVTAGRIVAWRTEHQRYTTVDELGEVPGIGAKTLDRLRSLVRV